MILGVAGLVLLVCAVAMAVTALVARRLGRVSVVDVTWGLAFVVVAAWTGFVLTTVPKKPSKSPPTVPSPGFETPDAVPRRLGSA